MSIIQVEATGQETLERMQKLLAGIPGGVEKAGKSAMSRTVSHLRTNSAKAIRERYDIPAANIRASESVSVRYSFQNGIQAAVTFAGRKIPLYRYGGASPAQPSADTGRLVRVMIGGQWRTVHPGVPVRGHQLKSTSPATFQNAFVARMKSGHVGIFKATGGMTSGKSEEIRELMGSSVPQMLGSPDVTESLVEKAVEKFEERLEHEINAILNGWRT